MLSKLPRFELTRVLEDGICQTPEITPVAAVPWDAQMGRRGALGTGIGLAGLAALLNGCARQLVCGAVSRNGECENLRHALKAHTRGIEGMIVTADGGTLISWETHEEKTKIWGLPDAKLLVTIDGEIGSARDAAVSPSGKLLVTSGGSESEGILWTVPEGKSVAKLGPVHKAAFSYDESLLATAGKGNALHVWRTATGEPVTKLEGSDSHIESLMFSRDGRFLVLRSLNDPLRVWSSKDWSLGGSTDGGHTAYLTPNGQTLLTIGSGVVTALHTENLGVHGRFKIVDGWTRLSPDGSILAAWNRDDVLQLWSISDSRLLTTLRGSVPHFSKSGRYMIARAEGQGRISLNLWALPSGTRLAHLGAVDPVLFLPDERTLVCKGYGDGQLSLWSVPSGGHITSICVGVEYPEALVATPDGRMVISAWSGGTIALTDIERGCSNYAFDPRATPKGINANSYNVYDETFGRWITYTAPCGTPLPPNATCTCNCVPGTAVERPSVVPESPSAGPGMYCSCNKVCTCVPVYGPAR